MSNNYHFQKKDELDLNQTIRLDTVSEKLKEFDEMIAEDDLGDADEYLSSFQSEKLDNRDNQRVVRNSEKSERVVRTERTERPINKSKNTPPPDEFLNKKNVTIFSLIFVAIAILGMFLTKIAFVDKNTDNVYMTKPMLIQGFLDNGQFIVYDIDQNMDIGLSINETSKISYAGHTVSTIEQFNIGDIVMISANDKKEVISIESCKNIVEQNITSIEADVSNKELKSINSNLTYTYHNKTKFYYNNKEIDPSTIHYTDILKGESYNGVLWVVEVVKSHGFFDLSNVSKIQEGIVQINKEAEILVEDFKIVTLPEGEHDLTITGKNIESQTMSFIIEAGKTYTYDLALAQEKQVVVFVKPNVSDYELYINDVLNDDSTQVIKPLGTYNFKIVKEGYKPWEEKITLEDSNTLNITPELEKELIFGTVAITTNTSGGRVYIDNEYAGDAPFEVNLPYETYSIRVIQDGFAPFSTNITVDEDFIYLNAELESTKEEVKEQDEQIEQEVFEDQE